MGSSQIQRCALDNVNRENTERLATALSEDSKLKVCVDGGLWRTGKSALGVADYLHCNDNGSFCFSVMYSVRLLNVVHSAFQWIGSCRDYGNGARNTTAPGSAR